MPRLGLAGRLSLEALLRTLQPPCESTPRRVLGLLDEAERLHQALEDGAGAAHARYLRALVHDALGQAQQRDADAAAHLASALQLSSVE